MKEIGGYIELDTYHLPMLYENAIKLNCGRNALAYLIDKKKINRILMPKFMCSSCDRILKTRSVDVRYYSIGIDFKPIGLEREPDEWLYIVNYYGQLPNHYLIEMGDRVIVDNAQAYFQEPVTGLDTIYTCRKFFGVADGAILCTDIVPEDMEQDFSFERMGFLLGRFEKNASEFYGEYIANNEWFEHEPIKKMSKLTENLLHGIDYNDIRNRRTENFLFLEKQFGKINLLSLSVPPGAFMYPFYMENGTKVRKALQKRGIYIPVLWPDVIERCMKTELEFDMAENILPLPVDQRYSLEEMEYLAEEIFHCMKRGV